MSLRRRLLLIVVLAAVALTVALVAVRHVVADSEAARERSAAGGAQVAALSLARAADGGELDAAARATASALPDAHAGFCDRDGRIVAMAGGGPPPPPDQREAISRLCRGDESSARLVHPHDVTRIAVSPPVPGLRAWTLVRVQLRGDDATTAWASTIGVLALVTLALVGLTLDAALALRRGAGQIEGAFAALEHDLRAPIERPRAAELGAIADGLVAMAAHLAEARDRERQLERHLAREQRLSALGRVTAGLAHEVRNPLAGLKLRLDVLRRAPGLTPDDAADLDVCLDEVARLDRLVGALLTVGRRGPSPTAFDLADLADERIAGMAGVAAARGVRFERSGSATVVADRDALCRVLDNLLKNAVEASPPGPVEVLVAGGEITVRDRGPGVPEDKRGQLFEPFFTTKADGTGLGLFVSRTLIEADGGTITYRRDGSWTSLTVSLA